MTQSNSPERKLVNIEIRHISPIFQLTEYLASIVRKKRRLIADNGADIARLLSALSRARNNVKVRLLVRRLENTIDSYTWGFEEKERKGDRDRDRETDRQTEKEIIIFLILEQRL